MAELSKPRNTSKNQQANAPILAAEQNLARFTLSEIPRVITNTRIEVRKLFLYDALLTNSACLNSFHQMLIA